MACCASVEIAARRCGDLMQEGYFDWYLPGLAELGKLYTNKTTISGFATKKPYQSATEYSSNKAWAKDCGSGAGMAYFKYTNTNYVRAIGTF